MVNLVELHWNFKDKKWNLATIGTVVKNEDNKSYYVPAEVHFIDPSKSRLVRIAWRVHLFFQFKSKKRNMFKMFTNPFFGDEYK